MRDFKCLIFVIFFISFFVNSCNSQQKADEQQFDRAVIDRQPAVAGQFYPGDKDELNNMLSELFKKAQPKKAENVAAIIAPHAGYVFSGEVAASSFNQVDFSRNFDNVFILASSHRAYFDGASIYILGNYITPLGVVNVNMDIADALIQENEYFTYDPRAHQTEHSIEVQLPFLQYNMGENLKIVPIVLGTQSPKVVKSIAESLKPYFNENNLFVISSDFSHYPNYENANLYDQKTGEALVANSSANFLQSINSKEDDDVPNLSTRACGWSALLTLIYLTENNQEFSYQKISYKNSGDTPYGDKDRVVGYHSIVVSRSYSNNSGFNLTNRDKTDLLRIARTTVDEITRTGKVSDLNENDFSENITKNCGAFVTLNKNHQLRGCIGRFTADEPLYKVVQEMAVAAATQDNRFMPVQQEELDEIDIEISVLTPMKKIESIDEIELGRHGIYIKKGYRSGTFLPQVATETGWTLEEFLGHCARDKAGIGWDGWKEAEIYVYEAVVFGENKK